MSDCSLLNNSSPTFNFTPQNSEDMVRSNYSTSTSQQQPKRRQVAKDQYPFKKNVGHWSQDEHTTYVKFLEEHTPSTLQNQQNRKNNKIFKLMAETIGTRSPSQCRSHHQKFNPFTVAGLKRSKKNRRRTNTESNIVHIEYDIKMPMTPEVRVQEQYDIMPIVECRQYQFPIQEDSYQQSQFEEQVDVANQEDYQEDIDDYFNHQPYSIQNDTNHWFQ